MYPFNDESIETRFEAFNHTPFALILRDLIFSISEEMGYGEIESSLKWNQPSFLVKHGTAVRIGETQDHMGLYVSCQTTIIDALRNTFPDQEYDKTRGLLLNPNEEIPEATKHLIIAAMTYKR